MSYEIHENMTDDKDGDIHLMVAADRAKVQATVAGMARSKDELNWFLYEVLVGAFFRRDVDQLLTASRLIMELNGWNDGTAAGPWPPAP